MDPLRSLSITSHAVLSVCQQSITFLVHSTMKSWPGSGGSRRVVAICLISLLSETLAAAESAGGGRKRSSYSEAGGHAGSVRMGPLGDFFTKSLIFWYALRLSIAPR